MARVVNLSNRHCMGRMVGVMEGGYCCRPPLLPSVGGEVVEEEEESDGEVGGVDAEKVAKETIADCVKATCRAMAGLGGEMMEG